MMKRLVTICAVAMIVMGIQAMSYEDACDRACYLTDKMCYELDLTDEQADAVYEINLDYLMSLESESDIYGRYWSRRNSDLQYVLTIAQYKQFTIIDYFYKPISFSSGAWRFAIYNIYTDITKFFRIKPATYKTYRGGNNKKGVSAYKDRKFTSTKKTEAPKTQQKVSEPKKSEVKSSQSKKTETKKAEGTTSGAKKAETKRTDSKQTETKRSDSQRSQSNSYGGSRNSGTTNHSSSPQSGDRK